MSPRALLLAASLLIACNVEIIPIARRELLGADAGDPDLGSDGDAEQTQDGGTHDAEPEADDAMADGGCLVADDCGQGNYCQRQNRDDRYGTCAQRPEDCEIAMNPVCGSDKISYFNDCIRKQHGVSFSTTGECPTNSRPCGDFFSLSECPPGTVCGRLNRSLAPDDLTLLCAFDIVAVPGQCWAVPDCGDRLADGFRWMPCLRAPPATFGGGNPGSSAGAGGGAGPGPGPGGGSCGGGTGGNFGGAGSECVDTCRAIASQEVHVLVATCPR